MNDQLTLQCGKCNHYSNFKISENMRGLKLKFKCQNQDCKTLISHTLPKVLSDSNSLSTGTAVGNNPIVIKAYLQLISAQNKVVAKYDLPISKSIVGRISNDPQKSPDIPIQTEDRFLSRQHIIVEGRKNRQESIVFTIKDNGSINGTIINGKRNLEKNEALYLENNDVITAGKTDLIFKEVYL